MVKGIIPEKKKELDGEKLSLKERFGNSRRKINTLIFFPRW